jgi:hypothetical protein
MNKTKLKKELIEQIIAEFDRIGEEFTCLASFNSVRSFSRQLATRAVAEHGIYFSSSVYFPEISSGDNLQFWASKEYFARNFKGK